MSDRAFTESQRKLIHLEALQTLICAHEGITKDDFEYESGFKTFRADKFQRLSVIVGVQSEW